MGKKDQQQGVGKSLLKKHSQKLNARRNKDTQFKQHQVIDDDSKPQLKSIIDQNSLEEFVQLAQLSNKKFNAEKEVTIINKKEVLQGSVESSHAQRELLNNFLTETSIKNPQYQLLRIPRKPHWEENIISTMSALEIQTRENMAFLQWRKDMATIEENNVNLAITPFEKNLEVWRQLWRVIESVQVSVEYFFYSEDLEKYIADVDKSKEFMLLVNKADYLTDDLREHWSAYFNQKGVKHIFFSALEEQVKIDHDEGDEESEEDEDEEEDEEEEEGEVNEDKQQNDGAQDQVKEGEEEKQKKKKKHEGLTIEEEKELHAKKLQQIVKKLNTSHVFTRTELMEILRGKAQEKSKTFEERLMVGFVGYPNVGKSSVINVICQQKRVGVANMPGKTKHFQTLNIEGNICLCDCPGLVFPSFANSKAEMMCCGVLPIDTMKDFVSPVSLIIFRVPKEVLESYYHILLPPTNSRKYNASIFLQIYAARKGYVTGRGLPNEAQAARIVLKDYTSGKLLFCHLRPDYDVNLHGPILNFRMCCLQIQQSGFHDTKFQVLTRNEAASQLEEVKSDRGEEEEKEGAAQTQNDGVEGEQSDDDEESKDTQLRWTQVKFSQNTVGDTSDLNSQSASAIPAKGQLYLSSSVREQEIDKDFFTQEQAQGFDQTATSLKLNKGERRALKFAILRGEKIDQIPNLKEYLAEQVKQSKNKKNLKSIAIAKKDNGRGGNNSNKFYGFAQLDDGNDSS